MEFASKDIYSFGNLVAKFPVVTSIQQVKLIRGGLKTQFFKLHSIGVITLAMAIRIFDPIHSISAAHLSSFKVLNWCR